METLLKLLVPLGLIFGRRKSEVRVYAVGPLKTMIDALTAAGFSPDITHVLDLNSGARTSFRSDVYDLTITIDAPTTARAGWDRIGHLIHKLAPDGVLAVACENSENSLASFALEPKIDSDEALLRLIADHGHIFSNADLPQPVMPRGVFSLIATRT